MINGETDMDVVSIQGGVTFNGLPLKDGASLETGGDIETVQDASEVLARVGQEGYFLVRDGSTTLRLGADADADIGGLPMDFATPGVSNSFYFNVNSGVLVVAISRPQQKRKRDFLISTLDAEIVLGSGGVFIHVKDNSTYIYSQTSAAALRAPLQAAQNTGWASELTPGSFVRIVDGAIDESYTPTAEDVTSARDLVERIEGRLER
ncbi:hypothetical protein [uncultured Rhodospira sp.]|uniref:hypothetical protein n=1 Tax=uncultured Rhodospira sp. TaxID=1936189 RepID=UPI0026272960|nr:hypothetical protein [uncultured Rhodospira sp.]